MIMRFEIRQEARHRLCHEPHDGDDGDSAEGGEGVEGGVGFEDEGEGFAGGAEGDVVGYYGGGGVGCGGGPGEGLDVGEVDLGGRHGGITRAVSYGGSGLGSSDDTQPLSLHSQRKTLETRESYSTLVTSVIAPHRSSAGYRGYFLCSGV